jgi:SAM-dependent methyltransferase
MAEGNSMSRFWDEAARENAWWYVDSRLDYSNPDVERFWTDGATTLERVLESVGVTIAPQDTVVDIGCGLGRLSRAASARAARVYAVDVSPEMIERARSYNAHLDNVEWLVGDGRHLNGVPDAAADGVFSHVVFQHVPDPQITLGYVTEMGRVLRPGGWAAFHVSNDPSVHRPRTGGLRGAIERRKGRAPRGGRNAAWLGSAVDVNALKRTADAAGLDTERVEGEGTQWCFVSLRRRA